MAFLGTGAARGDDAVVVPSKPGAQQTADVTDEQFVQLARKVRESIVTVTQLGRDHENLGLGTGFVVDESGLIATNRHVIGEARPIQVRFYNGTLADVESIYATDQQADLAILKIDLAKLKLKELKKLSLSELAKVEQGEIVAAIGHPQGLKNTLVSGIVSGYQEINARELIQVAMPIDHGNSGGPLMNRQGEVLGVITYKSSTTDNIGFAMPAASLRDLLKDPHPIPMSRWITIGMLNPAQWTPLSEAVWRQRAGRIQASGTGQGFGGRSLCLWQTPPADSQKYEIAVTLKLEDEAGAAGLVFQSDGGDRHYGFYPSAGQLRFSRFDGPDVFSWQVLEEAPSAAYRAGDWNQLKVQVEGNRFRCFCNEKLVFDVRDGVYMKGQVGLAKFRDTTASFKEFLLGEEIPSLNLPPALEQELQDFVTAAETPQLLTDRIVQHVSRYPETSSYFLEEEARQLELRAQALRSLARKTHEQRLIVQIVEQLEKEKVDLGLLALLLARFDNPEVELASYQEILQRMSAELRETIALQEKMTEVEKRQALDHYLFTENGFHGSRTSYYSKSNSYLNEVLDDREGLPVSLSVLYMVLGQSVGLDLRGIGLPGHFVVCHYVDDEPGDYVDVFDSARVLSPLQIQLQLSTTQADDPTILQAQTPRQILVRMVRNLKGIAESEEDFADTLRYLNLLVQIDEQNPVEHRYLRALILIRNKDSLAARADLDWLDLHGTELLGMARIEELRLFADRWLSDRAGAETESPAEER